MSARQQKGRARRGKWILGRARMEPESVAVAAEAELEIDPTLERARELAAEGNAIPVRMSFVDDCETPVSAFLKLRGEGPSFLLESAEQGRLGRYSFLGFNPRAVLRWSGGVLAEWDSLVGAWVKVMPMDYKRVLREREEAASIEAGEPSIIAEHGDGTGAGPVRAGQASPYNGGDGRQEAREPGAAGQREDAAVAAERAHKDGAGANDGEQAQIDEEAEEEVLPWNG